MVFSGEWEPGEVKHCSSLVLTFDEYFDLWDQLMGFHTELVYRLDELPMHHVPLGHTPVLAEWSERVNKGRI